MDIGDRACREAAYQVVGHVRKGMVSVESGLIREGLANRESGAVGGARDRREPECRSR
jgi:hypothetical protein